MTDLPGRLSATLADRYRIERELGQGGMATVYLAHDVRHDRKVALKLLRPELSAILGGARFLAEIKTTANLQHPHILSLFDSGEADGLVFYVMPYVDGESLRDRLQREKQLPVDEAVRIAREVADALHYAHQQGIVHRDIKPENILLHGGHAMVADFGIALAASRSDGGTRMTETGMSLGTPHYMAPEQAMGEREITPKADIYALGVVLYEMLTAEPPFTGATAQAIIARVMTESPRSLTLQRRTVPEHVEAAVGRALEKLPADRFATAAEFAAALEGGRTVGRSDGRETLPHGRKPTIRPSSRPTALIAAAALVIGLAAGWLLFGRQHAAAAAAVVRFTIEPSSQYALWDASGASPLAMSPDGSRLVFTASNRENAQPRLYIRQMSDLAASPLAGSESAQQPFFSADGRWIAFVDNSRLRKISVGGGNASTLAEFTGAQGCSWGDGDAIACSARDQLVLVPAAGGRPDTLVRTDSVVLSLRYPEFLPGGRVVLYTEVGRAATHVKAIDIRTRRITDLGVAGFNPRYVDPGFLLYGSSEGSLFAAPFDVRAVRVTGPAVIIAENVRFGSSGVLKMTHSRSGSIAFLSGNGGRRELVLSDRLGRVRAIPAPPNLYESPRFSPDGRRIAVAVGDLLGGATDIWTFDLLSGALSRVTFDSASTYPEWSRDGQWVHFATRRSGTYDLWRARSDGSGVQESVVVAPLDQWEGVPMPDGSGVIYRENTTALRRNILFMPRGAAAPVPILQTPFEERSLALSKDGHWLAYVSDETGADEVYVRGVPGSSGRVQMSTSGGSEPRWSPSGRELYYLSHDSLIVVEVVPAGAAPRPGRRTTLFANAFFRGGAGNHPGWDVSPDGNAFVFVRSRSITEENRITVYVNAMTRAVPASHE